MGTAEICDDVLIMADPYDTSDHCLNGYIIVSLERFFYEWFDAGVLSRGDHPSTVDCAAQAEFGKIFKNENALRQRIRTPARENPKNHSEIIDRMH